MRYGVILAGGGGTRLWPASRTAHPKQLLRLGSANETLLSATVRRVKSAGIEHIMVVTTASQANDIASAIPELPQSMIVSEPVPRNTAAAVGLAAVHLAHRDPSAIMAVVPSDQYIADEPAFAATMARAFATAEQSQSIVTVGIVPDSPATGFGYLEVAGSTGDEIRPVIRFVEKPDPTTAQRYFDSGNFLWNAGMFFCQATVLLAELQKYLPETHAGLMRIARALGDDEATRQVTATEYEKFPAVSIDYGVMEKTTGTQCVPGQFGWNDVGSWAAMAEICNHDASGNAVIGECVALDCHDNILFSDDDTVVAVLGVSDLVIAKSGNAVLVLPRERSQEVRAIVEELRKNRQRFL